MGESNAILQRMVKSVFSNKMLLELRPEWSEEVSGAAVGKEWGERSPGEQTPKALMSRLDVLKELQGGQHEVSGESRGESRRWSQWG